MIFFATRYIVSILVASLLFWSIFPEKYRSEFIGFGSFLLLFSLQSKFIFSLLLLIVGTYLLSKVIMRTKSKIILAVCIVSLILILLGGKYFETLVVYLPFEDIVVTNYIIPLGISYLIFKLIAFILDVYRGEIKDPSLSELLAFMFFVPMFSAGPIERYQNFAGKRRESFDSRLYVSGLQRLLVGYAKKIIVVDMLLHEVVINKWYVLLKGTGFSTADSELAILFMVGALLYAYFDLSAYADIAIGFGNLFGYRICENMHYPIVQKNISMFWNCWHISLSNWCRNNIYFPVLGKTRNGSIALYSSFFVMGLWHNITLNWLLWGVWHATGLIFFARWTRIKKRLKFSRKIFPKHIGQAFGITTTFMYVAIGYSFVLTDNIKQSLALLVSLF